MLYFKVEVSSVPSQQLVFADLKINNLTLSLERFLALLPLLVFFFLSLQSIYPLPLGTVLYVPSRVS